MAKNRGTVRKRRTNATRGRRNKLLNKKIAKYKNITGGRMGGDGHNLQNNQDYRDGWNEANPPMEINIKPGVGAIIFNILFSKCAGITFYKNSHGQYFDLKVWAKETGEKDANKKIPIEDIKKNYYKFYNHLQVFINKNYRVSNSYDKFIAEMCAIKAYWSNFDKKIIDQVWNEIMQEYLILKKTDRVLQNETIAEIIFTAEQKLQEQQPNVLGSAAATLRNQLTSNQPSIAAQNTAANSEIPFTSNNAEAIYGEALEHYESQKSKITDAETLMTDAKKLLKGSTTMINNNELVIAEKMVQLGYNITNLLSTVGGKRKPTHHKYTRRNKRN